MAVLVDELGHHPTDGSRPMLIAMWFAAPWRVTTGVPTGLAGALSGRMWQPSLQIMMFLGLAVAVVRDLHQGQGMVGGVLAALALLGVICPLADALVCQRAEFTADRFAADHGVALQLGAALRALNDASSAAPGWSRRLLAAHPSTELRISALLTVPVES